VDYEHGYCTAGKDDRTNEESAAYHGSSADKKCAMVALLCLQGGFRFKGKEHQREDVEREMSYV
jgi:hypothetical protein